MDKQTTKQKILNAAKKQFVDHGFAGASIGNIAKLAGVTRSLVFHHFNNKENLWVEVKQTIAQEAQQQTKTLPSLNLSFKEFLNELFNNNINFYKNNPDLIRLLNWQRLEREASNGIGVTHSNEAKNWIFSIQHYQTLGMIDRKLKPEYIMTLILSITSSVALDPNVFIREKKQLKEYISFCINGLIKQLEPKQ